MERTRLYAILWAAFAILSLGVLYFSLHAWLGEDHTEGPRVRTYRLSASASRPGREPPVFEATQEDTVTLLIRSEIPGEVHVHGYEKSVKLRPGGEVTLIFTAVEAGLYPLHLHEKHQGLDTTVVHHHLAALEVRPK